MNKILAFDVETGGLDHTKASLLTAYFVVLDDQLNAVDELELEIRNDNENDQYNVSAKALEINKIDLVSLQKRGITKDVARLKLLDLIKKHSEDGKNPLTPLTWNVPFDADFVKAHLIEKYTWDKYVSYRKLDPAGIALFLQHKGLIPANTSTSLGSIAKFFNLDLSKGAMHTAKFDTIVMVSIYEAMLKL